MRSEMSKTSETGAKADLARTSLLQCIESHEGKFTEYGSMNYAIHTKMGSMVLERDMETPSAQQTTLQHRGSGRHNLSPSQRSHPVSIPSGCTR